MKTPSTNPTSWHQRSAVGLTILALTLSAVLGSATSSNAALAGGAKIINTASVTWTGAAAPVTASVTVTVNNVSATPVVGTSETDATILASDTYTLENTAITLNYYVTNKGTGPETITLTDNSPNYSPTDIGNPTAPTAVIANIPLGASVASADAASGTKVLTVPSDGTSDGTVNGISAGDYIVIGSTIYQVDVGGVSDDATANVATITLTTNLTADVNIGDQIGERGSVTVAFTTGTLTSPPTTGTYAATVRATSTFGFAEGTHNVYVQRAALTISKEVSVNGGAFVGNTTAEAGDTLTYRIKVTNEGTAAAANVVITDPLPLYTTYVPGSARYRTADGIYAGATGLDDDADGAPDDDANGSYNWGVSAPDTATYTVNPLPAAGVRVLFFQVTIDNP